MKLNFETMKQTELAGFYGGEGVFFAKLFNDQQNKILKGCLAPGASIGYHCHESSAEIIFILSGEGIVNDNGVDLPLEAGDCHYCPKGESHGLRNEGKEDLIFYAVVPQQ